MDLKFTNEGPKGLLLCKTEAMLNETGDHYQELLNPELLEGHGAT